MKVLYVVQINMADEGQNPDWSNCRAFDTQAAAEQNIKWMRQEYGKDIPFQIVMLEYHPEAAQ